MDCVSVEGLAGMNDRRALHEITRNPNHTKLCSCCFVRVGSCDFVDRIVFVAALDALRNRWIILILLPVNSARIFRSFSLSLPSLSTFFLF